LDLLTYATPTQMQRLVREIQDAIETRAPRAWPGRRATGHSPPGPATMLTVIGLKQPEAHQAP